MAWAVGNVGTAVFGNNADVTPTNPVHADSEILFAVAAFRRKAVADGELITETGGGGWVQVYDGIGIAIFSLAATGSSMTDPTFAFAGGAAGDTTGAVVFTTTGGSVTIEDSAGLDNSTSTDVTFPALTIGETCLVIDIACVNDNPSFNNTPGWTEIVDSGTALGSDMQLGIQHQTTGSDTSSHVGTISLSTGSQTASIALQEAASGINSGVLRRRRI